jgi:uncharacterized protein (DUF2384 family)
MRERSSLSYLRVLEQVTSSGITQAELGKAVGAAVRTVQTWAAGDNHPKGIKAQRLLDVQTIVSLLHDAYTDEGIKIWLHSRNRNLDMSRPIDLLTEGRIDEVLEEAESVAGGM